MTSQRPEGMRVRLGIVSYRTPRELGRCLASLPDAVAGLDCEVVVVDNASGDESVEVAASFPGVRVVASQVNEGYARGMNRALGGSDAEVLVALNPDTLVPPGGVTALVRALLADGSVGLVSPRLAHGDGSPQHSVHRFPSPSQSLVTGFVPPRMRAGAIGRERWLEGYADLDHRAYVDWTVGAVHVIRRRALAGRAPYSERSFMYAEDMELCWRLHRDGWRVLFDPEVTVTHIGNVAGEREFGTAREERWLDATYDWYVAERGPAAARAWAAATAAGLSAKWATLAVTGHADHRRQVGELLSFHAHRTVDPRGDGHSRLAPGATGADATDRPSAFADELAQRFGSPVPLVTAEEVVDAAVAARVAGATAAVLVRATTDIATAVAEADAVGIALDFTGRVGPEDQRALLVARPSDASAAPPEDFRVLAVVPAYNEVDVIRSCVEYLLAQGVSVHVLDNWSTDGTAAALADLVGPDLTIERFPADGPSEYYAWGEILARVQEITATSGADWCVLHDADERRSGPWPGRPLRESFFEVSRRGYNAVDHTLVEFHPVDDSFEPGQDVEESLLYWAPARIGANRTQVKAWAAPRVTVDLVSSGGHDASFPGRRVFPYHFLLKHYPVRSQRHGESKVLHDRKPRWDPAERQRRWHRHYDHVREGHQFLKDPASLTRWDDWFDTDLLIERLTGGGALLPPEAPSPARARLVAGLEGLGLREPAVRVRQWYRIARRRDIETGQR